MDPIKRQYININLASLCNNTKNLPSLDIHIRIKIKSDGNHIIHEIHFRLLNDKVFFPYDSSKYDAQINNLLVKNADKLHNKSYTKISPKIAYHSFLLSSRSIDVF